MTPGLLRAVLRRLDAVFGGAARTRIVLIFGGVLALGSADIGMVGALARPLEAAFGISHTGLGLLATVSSGVGALAGGLVLSWRYGFVLLAADGAGLAAAIHRWLPEPARGGPSRVRAGDAEIPHAAPATPRRTDTGTGPHRITAGQAARPLAEPSPCSCGVVPCCGSRPRRAPRCSSASSPTRSRAWWARPGR
ncbi:hypothetical protein ABT369_10045 [Dactylosporangium sp. NPDC000244]|uniref:hypothetical protein n=1 Tax=Dactylosporangium sp. NPDC000244 TaxID=3154365 RepID=UPI0033295BCD